MRGSASSLMWSPTFATAPGGSGRGLGFDVPHTVRYRPAVLFQPVPRIQATVQYLQGLGVDVPRVGRPGLASRVCVSVHPPPPCAWRVCLIRCECPITPLGVASLSQ